MYRNGLPSNPLSKSPYQRSVSPAPTTSSLIDSDVEGIHNHSLTILLALKLATSSSSCNVHTMDSTAVHRPQEPNAELIMETTPEISPLPTTTELNLNTVPDGINSTMDNTIKNRTEFINNNQLVNEMGEEKDVHDSVLKEAAIQLTKQTSSVERDISTSHCICISKKKRIRNGDNYKYNIDVPYKGYTLIYVFLTTLTTHI